MPRISAANLGEHRALTLGRIYDATRELLGERGPATITLATVAARAGVGRTAIYNYFPDRETLLLEFITAETDDYLERLQADLAVCDNAVERISVFIRRQMEELAAQHLSIGGLTDTFSDEGRSKLLEHVLPISACLREAIIEAQEDRYLPEQDTSTALALVMATVTGRSTSRLSPEAPEERITSTIDYVLRGLGAQITAAGRPRRLPQSRATSLTSAAV